MKHPPYAGADKKPDAGADEKPDAGADEKPDEKPDGILARIMTKGANSSNHCPHPIRGTE
ncbi:hypothetical protein AB0E08_27870 [Streptomyces sp. NPDC048281]|uniref:hypothetical protein n=1 Tax=Streptomyces sp. NPDC048281 TaxID=3154715 RepID=UPI003445A327